MTVAKISLLFSFFDEDPVHICGEMRDQAKSCSYAHYLGLEFDSLRLVLQVNCFWTSIWLTLCFLLSVFQETNIDSICGKTVA